MLKHLFALPFLAAAMITAAPAQVAPAGPGLAVPAEVAADLDNRLTLELSSGGRVVVQLRPDAAPQHVERIKRLTRAGFYNGTPFHRVIPGFMAQGGDPTGTGQGGSKLPNLAAEFTRIPYMRGTVAMARADSPDSANSQFFIMYGPNVGLEKKYTVVGRVIEGMPAVDSIAPGEPPPQPTRVVRAWVGASPPPLQQAAQPAPAPASAPTPAPEPVPAEAPAPPTGG